MSTAINQFKDNLSWEEKAKLNPLFAVMSDDIFKESGTAFTEEQLAIFYLQGERFWKRWLETLLWDKTDIQALPIMEYGCGMGRILNQAAKAGIKSTGVDISASQLEFANQYCPNADKIEFILLDAHAVIPLKNESFDIVYSYAVLQHIKQSSALKLAIKEICRMVKKGGQVKVQLRSQHQFLSNGIYRGYRTVNFENSSLCFYFRKLGPIYLPVFRFSKHTNWTGACIYFSISSLIRQFKLQGVQTNQLEIDAENKLVWITGSKN